MRLRIVKSSFANPLVNLRIIPADLESSYNTPANTFRPEFLKQLEVRGGQTSGTCVRAWLCSLQACVRLHVRARLHFCPHSSSAAHACMRPSYGFKHHYTMHAH